MVWAFLYFLTLPYNLEHKKKDEVENVPCLPHKVENSTLFFNTSINMLHFLVCNIIFIIIYSLFTQMVDSRNGGVAQPRKLCSLDCISSCCQKSKILTNILQEHL